MVNGDLDDDEMEGSEAEDDEVELPERTGPLFGKKKSSGESKLSMLLGHKRKHGDEEDDDSDLEHSELGEVVDGVVVDEGDVKTRGVVVVNGVVEKDKGRGAEFKGKGAKTEKWIPPKQRDADLLFGRQRE